MNRTAALISAQFLSGEPPSAMLGGVTTYCRGLLDLLRDLEYQVTIIFPGYKYSETNYCGHRALSLPRGRHNRYTVLLGLPWEFQKALRRTLTGDEVAILTHVEVAYPYVPPRSIFVQHGISWDGAPADPTLQRSWRRRLLRRIEIASCARRDYWATERSLKTVCVDTAYISAYRQYSVARGRPCAGESEKLRFIPNFGDPVPEERIHSKIGQMVAGRSRILFARRFESYRGVELQIAAARRLAAEFPACEWLFAGSGPLLAQVEDACRTIPNAKLLRADPKEMQRLHDEVDIAVIPSVYSEGTSFSCIEAMCAGCVPVVTDVGGLTNLVLPDFNGCIIRPTEVDLSGALRSLVKNVEFRRRVAANAFATASGAFSREAWLRRWADVLAEVEVKATPGIRQDRKQ